MKILIFCINIILIILTTNGCGEHVPEKTYSNGSKVEDGHDKENMVFDDMHPFIPILLKVTRGSHILVEAPEISNPAFHAALDKVLTDYNIKHKYKDDIVFINKSLLHDRELMMNYTNKALDEIP